MILKSRQQAGELLANKLQSFAQSNAVVVGIARGGVVVSSVIATMLGLPHDVLVVKKIPSPLDPELAIGALVPENIYTVNWRLAHRVGADEAFIQEKTKDITDQIHQRIHLYRKGKKPLKVAGKTVILVDDGTATGATFEAAIMYLKKKHVKRLIAAIPVGSVEAIGHIKPEVDECVVLDVPANFGSVGHYYKEFPQVDDAEVVKLLQSAYPIHDKSASKAAG